MPPKTSFYLILKSEVNATSLENGNKASFVRPEIVGAS